MCVSGASTPPMGTQSSRNARSSTVMARASLAAHLSRSSARPETTESALSCPASRNHLTRDSHQTSSGRRSSISSPSCVTMSKGRAARTMSCAWLPPTTHAPQQRPNSARKTLDMPTIRASPQYAPRVYLKRLTLMCTLYSDLYLTCTPGNATRAG